MKFLTFGESLLRLRAPGRERLFQRPALEATFGGAEANVAVSLANFGAEAAYCTILPANPIGDACLGELRRFGVDTRNVLRGPGRLGIYYLEDGANQLSPKVIYDRSGSSLAQAGPGAIDWRRALEGIGWLHTTGITPAISEGAMELCLEAVQAAKGQGITVSCDLNYRKALWQYGREAPSVMREVLRSTDVVIASEEEMQTVLGISACGSSELERYRSMGDQVLSAFPAVKLVAMILRESRSADWHSWSACLNSGADFYVSKRYEIRDIVDGVGGGDAFAAGLIYGLNRWEDHQQALEFAAAASCLKYSIVGDFNRVSTEDVLHLSGGDGTGRDQR